MRYAESTFGGVDIVINNAGIQHVAPVEQFPVDKWNDILAINLSSVFHTTRPALPGMRQRNWGRIINIASVHGPVASKEKSAYVAAKHAVVGLTKTVARNRAQRHHLQRHLPGWVLTRWCSSRSTNASPRGRPGAGQRPAAGGKQPSGEFVTRSSWAKWRCFCAAMPPPVRGAAWNMDGGWVAQ